MPLENRNLEPGTALTARHKGETHTAEVVQTDDGLRYRLADGREFKSPSSAGKAVTGGACNGWVFWSLAGEETAQPKKSTAKKESAAKPTAHGTPAKAKSGAKKGRGKKAKSGKKSKAMRAASKNDASYGCGACGETFPTMKAATQHALTHTT